MTAINQIKAFYQNLTKTTTRKVVFWGATLFFFFVFSLTMGVWRYQSEIIQAFVQEANKHLEAEVSPKAISVTIWKDFPNVSIAFDRVLVKETGKPKNQADTLAYFQTLYFTFHLGELIDGNYKLQQLYAQNGKVTMQIDAKGRQNFQIIKPSENNKREKNFNFRMNRIVLHNVDFSFKHLGQKDSYKLHVKELTAKLDFSSKLLETRIEADCQLHDLIVGNNTFAQNKSLKINLPFIYEFIPGSLQIEPANLQIGESVFALEGVYEPENRKHLYLKLDGKNANLQTILALLPTGARDRLSEYRTKGTAYFNAEVDGFLSDKRSPSISVKFGFTNVAFFHPDLNQEISKLNLKGSFTNGKAQSLLSSEVQIDSISGQLGQNPFEGSFSVRNFSNPFLKLKAKASIEVADLLAFYPIERIKKASGQLSANLTYEGEIQNPSHEKASGWLQLKNLSANWANHPDTWKIENFYTQLAGNQLSIDTCLLRVKDSDINLTGKVQNWANLGAGNLAKVLIDAQSGVTDLNQLFAFETTKSGSVGFTMPNIRIKLKSGKLKFKEWIFEEVSGSLGVSDGYEFEQLSFNWLEGDFLLNGNLKMTEAENRFSGTVGMQSVNIRTFFQTFNDFGLDAISYVNLEGQTSAEIATTLWLTPNWDISWPKSEAIIEGEIRNGKLLNYEPMQQVAFLMKNKDLENISFPRLSNSMMLRSDTLFIPRMEINSSVGNMFVSGKQQISGAMEYHLQVPLNNFKKPDKDEAFGAIEDDGLGNGNLFLLITGTPTNFKVGYDKKEVGEKIKDDLKKEKKEFSDLFKKKKKEKEKQVGLGGKGF